MTGKSYIVWGTLFPEHYVTDTGPAGLQQRRTTGKTAGSCCWSDIDGDNGMHELAAPGGFEWHEVAFKMRHGPRSLQFIMMKHYTCT